VKSGSRQFQMHTNARSRLSRWACAQVHELYNMILRYHLYLLETRKKVSCAVKSGTLFLFLRAQALRAFHAMPRMTAGLRRRAARAAARPVYAFSQEAPSLFYLGTPQFPTSASWSFLLNGQQANVSKTGGNADR